MKTVTALSAIGAALALAACSFAVATVRGRTSLPGIPPWADLKALVAASPDSREISSRPR